MDMMGHLGYVYENDQLEPHVARKTKKRIKIEKVLALLNPISVPSCLVISASLDLRTTIPPVRYSHVV
jgi:hypothetical protein